LYLFVDVVSCLIFLHFQVHHSMCTELTMMLDKISSILPSIEAARPGCKAGIQELCNLYNTVEKGKFIIMHCIECSKLYLVRCFLWET
jgi:hypothetical protein